MFEVRFYKDNTIRMECRELDDGNVQMMFAVIDVVSAITSSKNPRKYWNVLKHRIGTSDPDLRSEIEQIRIPGENGRLSKTDIATSTVIIKVIRHIPEGRKYENDIVEWLERQSDAANVMLPVMRGSYAPGKLMDKYDSIISEGDMSLICAELEYYRGNFEDAVWIAQSHLLDTNLYASGSAANICALGNIALGRLEEAEKAIGRMKFIMEEAARQNRKQIQSLMEIMIDAIFAGLEHPEKLSATSYLLRIEEIPEELRLWAWHLYGRRLCIDGEYEKAIGATEVARTILKGPHPIQEAYIDVIAAVAMINLKMIDQARELLVRAFKLCQPDGICAPLGDAQLIMPGLIDERFKLEHPEECEKIELFTEALLGGVHKFRKQMGDEYVPSCINRRERTLAVLASKGWNNSEIADYLNLSENTVRRYLSVVYEKLHISGRKELRRYNFG